MPQRIATHVELAECANEHASASPSSLIRCNRRKGGSVNIRVRKTKL